jgi:hypothetical protein
MPVSVRTHFDPSLNDILMIKPSRSRPPGIDAVLARSSIAVLDGT